MPITQNATGTTVWALVLILLSFSSFAVAQDEESGAAVANPDELGRIFGDAQIFYDETEVIIDEESGGLIGLTLNGDVRIRSDKIDLDCDFLKYDVSKDRVITTGSTKRPVKLRQGKTMAASCQKLVMYPSEGKFVLTGNVIVISTPPGGGSPFKTTANEITLVQQKDGPMRILIDSGGQFKLGDGPTRKTRPAEIIIDDPANFTGATEAKEPTSEEPKSRIAKPKPEPLNKRTSSKMPSVSE